MTGMELSTSVRFGLSPIVVIFDNGRYAVERLMVDGTFNDVLAWDYTKIPELFGSGVAFDVRTEGDLDRALAGAIEHAGDLVRLRVQLDPTDVSPAMRRLATQFGAAAVASAEA
jgi:TPP-dependent 2-oxoacid decarboxylase